MCVRGRPATFLAGISRLSWLPQPGGGNKQQRSNLTSALHGWVGPTKKTPAGHSFVHVHPACTDQLSLLVSPPLNSSSPSLNEHSYAFDRVDELRTYLLLPLPPPPLLLLLPPDYLLCCVPAPLFLLFTNIVSPRDKLLLKQMGTPYGSGPPDYSNSPPSYDRNDEDHIAPTPHNLPAGQQMRLLGSMDEPMYP